VLEGRGPLGIRFEADGMRAEGLIRHDAHENGRLRLPVERAVEVAAGVGAEQLLSLKATTEDGSRSERPDALGGRRGGMRGGRHTVPRIYAKAPQNGRKSKPITFPR